MENRNERSYQIKLASKVDVGRLVEFVVNYYYGYDPITELYVKKMGTKSRFCSASIKIGNAEMIQEGLSVMAVNDAGEIIGAILNETLKNDSTSSTVELGMLIDRVNGTMNDKLHANNEMVSSVLVVHPDWQRKGVARDLLLHTIELAKEKKFDQIRCHCTNAYSARVYEKCGFEYIHSVRYEDYKIDDKVVFTPRSPHTHIHGMALRLDN